MYGILSVIFFIISFFYFCVSDNPWDRKYMLRVKIGVFSLILAVIFTFKSEFDRIDIENSAYFTEEQNGFYELVSLRDTTRIQGSLSGNLFYINGSTAEEDYYSFYYKLGNGYKKGKIPTHDTIIYEYISDEFPNPSDSKYSILYDAEGNFIPSIIKYDIYRHYNITEKQIEQQFLYPQYKLETTRYEIHVPKGTILREFNLDSL